MLLKVMDADKLNLLGHKAMLKGDVNSAFEYFKSAVKANPLLPQSHYNLGVCYMAWGMHKEAVEKYTDALKLSPGNTVILNNLGVTYGKMGKTEESLKFYKKALETEPENIFALSNIGSIYVERGSPKAKEYLEKAIKINPHLPDAQYNMGVFLASQGDKKSIQHFQKAIAENPEYAPTWGLLYHQVRAICDFEKAKKLEGAIEKINERNIKSGILPAHTPFESVVFNDNPKNNFDIARIWSRYYDSLKPSRSFAFYPPKEKRSIRIGYLSSDFYNHATLNLLIGVLRHHSRDDFGIYTYSYGPNDKSSIREEVENLHRFRDVSNFSDGEIADLIYRDKIDILIDLKGYTQKSRLGIIASRPAPIIISWLGFPGTTGADFVDYMITDSIVTPKSQEKFYSENLIYMPFSYQPTNNQQEILEGNPRGNYKLPEKGFLFCSFNQAYKIDPKTFSSWMKILKRVPDSKLCLLGEDESLIKNLRSEAKKAGVDPKRLVFLPNTPRRAHLGRISACNLALDTFICNGHTTTTDSLWARTPVVALMGNHFASRVSASLLSAAGLPGLIAKSPKDYENLAVKLAKDRVFYRNIKNELSVKRLTYPLFDTGRFTKNLEDAYRQVWGLYAKEQLPKNIIVKDKIGLNVLSMVNCNLGAVYLEEKRNKEAVKILKKAVRQDPKNALAFNNLGTAYNAVGEVELAEANWKKSALLDPTFIEPLSNLGVFYDSVGEKMNAIGYFRKILNINPNDSNTYNNLGVVHIYLSQYPEAIKYLHKAVDLSPNDYAANHHLGLAYRLVANYEDAIKYFKKAIELKPDYGAAINNYALALKRICDWENFEKMAKKIPVKDESPYLSVARVQDNKINYEVAKSRSEEIKDEIYKTLPVKNFRFLYDKPSKNKKIRIGYISRDFFHHATAYLILGLFENHDRSKFEVFAYSYGHNDGSFYRKKLERDADKFIDISEMGNFEAAKKINSDKIDILIDLKGHTKDTRLSILAVKPAPIQATWLGYPGTTGADFIDYILTDKIVTPQKDQKFYSEKFAYLPNSYQINDDKRIIADMSFTRSDFSLPKNAVIFSCFNQTGKIDPKTFSSWMKILKRVPNSVLWLIKSNSPAEKNLVMHAKNAGINPKRLVFADHIEVAEHLARISLADLSLDTFDYNGHTTSSDSLWAGVPVITLKGKHFASRVAASLLSAIGLPELITNTQKEYEDLAVKLAKNPEKIKQLKEKLQKNKFTQPLFDTKRFVKDIEQLYLNMWGKYLSKK